MRSTRRALLKGAGGALLALPFLESLAPREASGCHAGDSAGMRPMIAASATPSIVVMCDRPALDLRAMPAPILVLGDDQLPANSSTWRMRTSAPAAPSRVPRVLGAWVPGSGSARVQLAGSSATLLEALPRYLYGTHRYRSFARRRLG